MTWVDIGIIIVLLSFVPLAIGIVGLWITAIRLMIFQIWEDNTRKDYPDWLVKLAKDARDGKLPSSQQGKGKD